MRETDLYGPVKVLMEGQGYRVKGEIGAADLVALRGDEAPVIVELKTAFSLALLHQAVARQALTDKVYVAVPKWRGRAGWKAFSANAGLCRRLGLGIIVVEAGTATAVHDPAPYQPRQSKPRRELLLAEFSRRVGDPNQGGSTRTTIMTAYRQDALRCLGYLGATGPSKAAAVATALGVGRARQIMADDHYGWFERVERGIYAITPRGRQALLDQREHIEALT